MGVGELCPTACDLDVTIVGNSQRENLLMSVVKQVEEAGGVGRPRKTAGAAVSDNHRNWERWRWGHDDDNPTIGTSGGRVFAQSLLAQGLLALHRHVSVRRHQAQRLNPPFPHPRAWFTY